MLFELTRMANIKNGPDEIALHHGLVGFFDILGFSGMLSNNEPEQINTIIRDVFIHIPGELNFRSMELNNYDLNPGYIVFSDSILVYQKEPAIGISDETVAGRFIRYCCHLSKELLLSGLPVRGAISKGKFSIIEVKPGNSSFTGKCFVEAHALAEMLQLAACAISPAVELEFLENGDQVKKSFRNDLCYWSTPVKNLSQQRLLLLDYSHLFQNINQISRATLIECFGRHKKDISLEVLSKMENTLAFLKGQKDTR